MDDLTGFLDNFKPGKPEFKSKKSPWDFRSPTYDERKGPSVSAGDRYGAGKPQPVGRVGNPKTHADALPFGRVKTMKVDEV